MSSKGNWAIAIHGGAGSISRSIVPLPYEQALETALDAAYDVLENGPQSRFAAPWTRANIAFPPIAVAAALAAVESMESEPLFNAGKHSHNLSTSSSSPFFLFCPACILNVPLNRCLVNQEEVLF